MRPFNYTMIGVLNLILGAIPPFDWVSAICLIAAVLNLGYAVLLLAKGGE